jgi:hypothetical protein
MTWIDEMLSRRKASLDSESALRKRTHSEHGPAEKPEKLISVGEEAWAELLAVLRKDVKEFNDNKSRAGHSPVLMSTEKIALAKFQFEVYVPEMNSRLMVLTLTGNSLHVDVRPKFPDQQSTITLESSKNGKHYFWLLDATGKSKKELSVQDLSEYVLRPILSSSEVD